MDIDIMKKKKKITLEELFPNNRNNEYCQCLYEIENNLPRTKYCFMACKAQLIILSQRKNEKSK